jgi:hypothetical protein
MKTLIAVVLHGGRKPTAKSINLSPVDSLLNRLYLLPSQGTTHQSTTGNRITSQDCHQTKSYISQGPLSLPSPVSISLTSRRLPRTSAYRARHDLVGTGETIDCPDQRPPTQTLRPENRQTPLLHRSSSTTWPPQHIFQSSAHAWP